MSRGLSSATGKCYGVERMSRVLRIPRSTIYARRHAAIVPKPTPAKRGPKPAISDDALLEAIREDLKNSPFKGEGHRKVWARLKFCQGMQVSRKRVLRIMRENNLLSPYRKPQGEPSEHDGTIGTDAPR